VFFGQFHRAIAARQIEGEGQPPLLTAQLGSGDPGLSHRDPGIALAAQFEGLVDLKRRLCSAKAVIGARTGKVLAIEADGRVGPGAGLHGQPLRLFDIGLQRFDARRLLRLTQQLRKGRRGIGPRRVRRHNRGEHAGQREKAPPTDGNSHDRDPHRRTSAGARSANQEVQP
jgi:hypothetical protein